MPLFCPDCSATADDDAPWCDRCGSDLVPSDGALVAVPELVRRHDVTIDRIRVNCICHGTRLLHDPSTNVVASVFSCSRNPDRIDCVGCRVCPTCGDLRCTCGLLAICIGVRINSTVIETLPVRRRLR